MGKLLLLALVSLLLSLSNVSAKLLLKGGGATTAQRLMTALLPIVNKKYNVGISYSAIGSGAGRKGLLNGTLDFAMSDVPFTSGEESKFKGAKKFTLPVALQTISIFVFIPQNKQNLKFTPGLIARIFSRKITKWDHKDILKLNPSLSVPKGQKIFVVHRRDSSGSTNVFTQWLKLVAPQLWKLGVGGDIKWPAGTLSGVGSAGVAATMRSYPYSIGYLGTSVGYGLGLNEAFIPNRAGIYRRAAGSDVMASVPNDLPPSTSPWTGISLINRSGKQTWPLTSFLYSFAKKNATKLKARGGLLKAFLKYLNSNSAQTFLVNYQFYRLPQKITKKNLAAISTLTLAKGVKVPF